MEERVFAYKRERDPAGFFEAEVCLAHTPYYHWTHKDSQKTGAEPIGPAQPTICMHCGSRPHVEDMAWPGLDLSVVDKVKLLHLVEQLSLSTSGVPTGNYSCIRLSLWVLLWSTTIF